jgi:hypothetical protein
MMEEVVKLQAARKTARKQNPAPVEEPSTPLKALEALMEGHEDVIAYKEAATAEPGMVYLEADAYKSTRPSGSGDPARH